MRVKLARVRVVFEEVEVDDECGRCGACVVAPNAVAAWHLGEFSQIGGLANVAKGVMGVVSNSERMHGKKPVCVRELRCAKCGTELAALPIKVADVKEAAAEGTLAEATA